MLAQPKQEAFINSQEHFLKNQYSDVITSLSDYKVEDMPKVVQYELARSYIIIDNGLMDDQREVILNIDYLTNGSTVLLLLDLYGKRQC